MDEIILDKKTFKALAIDTRVDILKSLNKRRKTASELSKELHLSVPTIAEHLEKMRKANLVKKEKQGKKWVYYALTIKGTKILSPKVSSVFVFALTVSLALILIGSLNIFTLVGTPYTVEKTFSVPGETVESYEYETAEDKATGGVTIGAGTEASAPTSPENTATTQRNQTQTITETHMSYVREISYEYIGVLAIGLLIFIFFLFYYFKKR